MKKVAMLAFVLACMAGTLVFSADNDGSLTQFIAKSKTQEVGAVAAPKTVAESVYKGPEIAIGDFPHPSTVNEAFLVKIMGAAAKTFYDKVLSEVEAKPIVGCPAGMQCPTGYEKVGQHILCSKYDKGQPMITAENEYLCFITMNSKGFVSTK
jgi:hypothetical protein